MATGTMELGLSNNTLIKATDQSLELHSVRCAFCGLGEGQVERLFEGRSRYVCNDCIRVCIILMSDYKSVGYQPPWRRTAWYLRWFRGDPNGTISCSFCGAERIKNEYMMASRFSQICERCIRACQSIGNDSFSS